MSANATPEKTRRARRAVRWLGAGVVAIIAIVALTLIALATAPGRNLLASLIERATRVNGVTIAITNLSGWPPFRFGAEKVVIADSIGPFAEIEHLDATLRVSDLLTGGVGFESIAVEHASIARRPVLVSEDKTSEPVSLALDRIAIARLDLGETFAGTKAALVVAGSYRSRTSGETRANINVERVDGKKGNVNVTVARAGRSAPFIIDARAEEAPDGILVGLLGRETGPDYRLQAKTEVNDRVLEGTLTLASGGAAQFNGRLSLGLDGDARKIAAQGDGDFGELLPADLVPLLGGKVHVAVDADWSPVRNGLPRVAVREAVLRSSNLQFEASGVLDEKAPTLKFALDLERPDGSPLAIPGVPDVRVGSIALTGGAARASGVTRIEAGGAITGFAAPEVSVPRADVAFAVSSTGDKPFTGGTLPYSLRINADSIVAKAEGSFDTAKSEATARVTLAAGATTASFDGDLGGKGVNGKLAAHVPDLRALARFTGRTLKGSLDATATGTFASANGIKLDIAGDANNFDPGDATVAKLLAGKTHVETKFARIPAGTMTFSNLVLNASALKAGGSATLNPTTIEAKIEGRLADLALLAKDTQGAAQFALSRISKHRCGSTADACSARTSSSSRRGSPDSPSRAAGPAISRSMVAMRASGSMVQPTHRSRPDRICSTCRGSTSRSATTVSTVASGGLRGASSMAHSISSRRTSRRSRRSRSSRRRARRMRNWRSRVPMHGR